MQRANWRRHRLLALTLTLLGCGKWGYRDDPGARYDAFRATNAPPNVLTSNAVQPVVAFHIRAYADDAYRTQVPEWQQTIRRQLDGVNAYIRERLHARLVVDSVAEWRNPVEQADMAAYAPAFARVDRGDDVDWVIVYVGKHFEELGQHFEFSTPGSKLLFLRPADSLAEWESAKAVKGIDRGVLDALTRDRVKHRRLMFALRAWARSLGVPYDADYGHMMAPRYDLHAAEFSAGSIRILRIGLQHAADATAAGRLAWGEAVLRVIAENPQEFEPSAAADTRKWMVVAP